MCSNDDNLDDIDEHMAIDTSASAIGHVAGVCKKCGDNYNVEYKLPHREPECRDCFLAYVTHKFRAALGSSKILPRGVKAMLLFDGSAESIALLDMVQRAQTLKTFKRLDCQATVVYIDELTLTDAATGRTKLVYDFLSTYPDIPHYLVPLALSNGNEEKAELFSTWADYDSRTSIGKEYKFAEITHAMASKTSREDFIRQYRRRLCAKVASQLRHDFCLLPDVSKTMAAELLTAVALGRGGSAALDVAFLDDRQLNGHGGKNPVKFLRPIREITQDEIRLYLAARDLTKYASALAKNDQSDDTPTSLQELTIRFVEGLQRNYASTVSTVFRTGNKIASKAYSEDTNDEVETQVTCAFCSSNVDLTDSSTLLAIEFSRLASAAGKSLEETTSASLPNLGQRNGERSGPTLCYACNNIQKDATNKHLLTQ